MNAASEPPKTKPGVNKDEVLNHWIGFAEPFSIAPSEFYVALQKKLTMRKIPGLTISNVDYPEGGLLSESRVYLRLIRERLAFDTCAAPFGTGYFFSCRSIYSPPILKLWHIIVILAVLYLLYVPLAKLLGMIYAGIAVFGLIITVGLVFRNAVASGLSDLDALLIKTPALGPVYERYFRKDTYYRQDARMFYLEAVTTIFKELAEEMTASKGVKLVRQFERAPIFGELYKPVRQASKEEALA